MPKTPPFNVTVSKLEQFANTWFPTIAKLSETTNILMLSQFLNALSAISTTEDGIVTVPETGTTSSLEIAESEIQL